MIINLQTTALSSPQLMALIRLRTVSPTVLYGANAPSPTIFGNAPVNHGAASWPSNIPL